jgi:predicted DNA-binding transcriptional regulator AlpA
MMTNEKPFDISKDRLITKNEVCKVMSISLSTLERMIKAGTFPDAPFTLAGMKRWSEVTVGEWINKQKKEQ